MTGVALDLDVGSPQRKFGLIVIKVDRLPFNLVVAGLAFCAIAAAVHILQPVARYAGGWQVLVELVGMAGRAGDLLVGSLQRKSRLAVVEWLRLRPLCHRMAVLAALQPALVGIDILVTFKAY